MKEIKKPDSVESFEIIDLEEKLDFGLWDGACDCACDVDGACGNDIDAVCADVGCGGGGGGTSGGGGSS